MKNPARLGLAIAICLWSCSGGLAAEEHGLPGATMPILWAVPFVGLLLSIATGPLLYPHVWSIITARSRLCGRPWSSPRWR